MMNYMVRISNMICLVFLYICVRWKYVDIKLIKLTRMLQDLLKDKLEARVEIW